MVITGTVHLWDFTLSNQPLIGNLPGGLSYFKKIIHSRIKNAISHCDSKLQIYCIIKQNHIKLTSFHSVLTKQRIKHFKLNELAFSMIVYFCSLTVIIPQTLAIEVSATFLKLNHSPIHTTIWHHINPSDILHTSIHTNAHNTLCGAPIISRLSNI